MDDVASKNREVLPRPRAAPNMFARADEAGTMLAIMSAAGRSDAGGGVTGVRVADGRPVGGG